MAKINEGWLDFDVAIATTEAMKTVRTIARVLGPKGLMPNPKSGTVTDDIAAGIKAVKAGRVEFKMDKTANIGVGIGKRSFTAAQILENAQAVLEAVGKAKPASFKGSHYIKTVALSSSMSPAVQDRVHRVQQILNRSPDHESRKTIPDRRGRDHLKKSDYVILANFTKVTVADVAELRKKLAAEKAEFHVVKNSSLRVAAKALGLPDIESALTGPTAVVVGGKNSAGVAKVLKKFFKDKQKLEVKVGVMDKKLITAADLAKIADLPSFEALRAQLLGLFTRTPRPSSASRRQGQEGVSPQLRARP
jgi:large subunit ribosomal protein L10